MRVTQKKGSKKIMLKKTMVDMVI